MSWYKTALRKHMMRADLHIHAGDESDFNDPQIKESSIRSILTAAIIKGLDVVGIIAHDGPNMGWQAQEIAKNTRLDLWVIPGQEYVCSDKIRLLAYYIKQPLQPNLTYSQVVELVHKQHGLIMVIDLTKRQSQMINKSKGTVMAPDAIEIYNASVGGYHDVEVDFPKFISSASKSAKDIETINVFTLINRKDLESIGFIPVGEGTDYVPKYLQRDDAIDTYGGYGQMADPDSQPQNPNDPNANLPQQTAIPEPQR